VGPDAWSHVVEVAAIDADVVVVHVPRALDPYARVGLRTADRIVEVLSLDVLSFRAATRALEALDPLGVGARIGFVVNRVARGEITVGDVARVFGAEPLATFPVDRAVGRAQDHGRLLPAKGRMARAFDRLAARVFEIPEPQPGRPAEVTASP
jgi:Flp pilus assembly CpaE family ATPase